MSNFSNQAIGLDDVYNIQNQQIDNSISQCREGQKLRRDLLQQNPMEDLNYKNTDYSEVNRSIAYDNIIISKRKRDKNDSISIEDKKNTDRESSFIVEPQQSVQSNQKIQFYYQNDFLQPLNERMNNTNCLEQMIARKEDPSINNNDITRQTFNKSNINVSTRINLASLRNLHQSDLTPDEMNNKMPKESLIETNIVTINNLEKQTPSRTFFWFSRLQYFKKFADIIKYKSQAYLFRHMKEYQFDILCDPAANYGYYIRKQMLAEYVAFFNQILYS